MKLKKFLADLNKLAKEHPEYLKYEVIYSIDDEANSFLTIYRIAKRYNLIEETNNPIIFYFEKAVKNG